MPKKREKKQTAKDIMLAHSKAKVDFYQAYLTRYLSIMSVTQYVDSINIFDVFCGRGEYADGGLGSPIRAVQTIQQVKQERPSTLKINLYLNDAEKKHIERVKVYIREHFADISNYCAIHYLNMPANDLLNRLCNLLTQRPSNERNFIFVDPYGYKDIHRDLFQRLMKNGRTEILLFLPISFMHRFRNYAFNESANKGALPLKAFISEFFPENHPVRNDEEMDVIEYIEALTQAFSIDNTYYTTNYFIERDAHNYFALFFISNNLLGFEKAVDTKWYFDEEAGKGFYQTQNTSQLSLWGEFEKNEQILKQKSKLVEKLKVYLSSKERSNAELYEFTLRLGYKTSHMNEVLRELQNDGKIKVTMYGTDTEARKGSFYINYKDAKNPLSPKVYIKLI